MATFGEDGQIYIKLDANGKSPCDDRIWDDGVGGRVKQILIWHQKGFHLSGIQIIYERNGDKQSNLISKRHGGTEGNFEMITPRKPLTWLSGHYGSYSYDPENFSSKDDYPWDYYTAIASLKFGNQEETYGPFGQEKGTPFFFRGCTEIVGFHGYSSDATTDSRFGYISAIGIYIKTDAVGVVGQPSASKDGSQDMIESESKPKLISGK